MNYLDIIILIPCLWFAYKGFKNGLIMELISLAALIAGIYLAIHFSHFAVEAFDLDGKYSALIAFIITFLAVVIGVFILGKLLEGLLAKGALDFINKLAGMLLGILKTLLIFGMLILIWNKVDTKEHILKPEKRNESFLFRPLEKSINFLFPHLKTYVKENLT